MGNVSNKLKATADYDQQGKEEQDTVGNASNKPKATAGLIQQGEEEKETAKSVQKWYRNRLRYFGELLDNRTLVEVDLDELGLSCNDSLGDLFKRVQWMVRDRANIKTQLIEEQSRAAKNAYEIQQQHVKKNRELREEYEDKLAKLASKKDQMGKDHERHIRNMTLQHSQDMDKAEQKFKSEKQKLESEKLHIQSQLLTTQEKSYAWSEEKLRVQFQELCRLVNNATGEIAQLIDIPVSGLGHQLDPDGTAGVTGSTGVCFWLRSRAWGIIDAGFFSQPYGFGAFGPDKGARELMDVFRAWASRLGRVGDSDSTHDIVSMFRDDENATRWRSATFQSLSTGGSLHSEGLTNAERVADQLHRLLSAVASAGNVAPSGALNHLDTAAKIAFDLALQCGINPVALRLLSMRRGSRVVIERAKGFIDCKDECEEGETVTAALVVQPGLVRGGSGRQTFIVPCEIFAGGYTGS